jgi:hypothetical protein
VFASLARANHSITTGDSTELGEWSEAAQALALRYPAAQLRARMIEHFDGFRTLKLIHALSARWPKLPWSEAVARAPFLRLDTELPLEAQRERLAELESVA